jgi:hypothetical protein
LIKKELLSNWILVINNYDFDTYKIIFDTELMDMVFTFNDVGENELELMDFFI